MKQKEKMENNTTRHFLKDYSDIQIESHLFYSFIVCNNIDYSKNKTTKQYFSNNPIDNELLELISGRNNKTLEALSEDLENLIPVEDRKLNGAFFTPAYIVDYIIQNIKPGKTAIVADISCGLGVFLFGLIRYYKTNYGKTIKQILKDNVFGVDILDYNVRRCKLLLILYALMEGENIEEDDINVKNFDSLNHQWQTKFDGIIGNPPYVKFQDLDEATRNELLSKWETTRYGTFNLYFAFFELGHKLLKPDGELGFITPNNYFTSLSGECLRSYFQMQGCVYKITDFYATKVFSVQTYTAITFLNKKKNKHIDYARINGEDPKLFLTTATFTPNGYDSLNIKKWRLFCNDEKKIISAIENTGTSIGSLFNICVGIATLKDEVYFIDPKGENRECYLFEKNGISYSVEKEMTRSLVKISDMKSQQDIECNHRRIIFPYKKAQNGKVVVISEDEMKTTYPSCYQYLLSVKEVLDGRGKGKHKYSPFYVYGRTQGLNRYGVKILTPTFSKYPRFLLDNNTDGFFTNGYAIYLKKENDGNLFSNPITNEGNFDVVQKIMNSGLMHYYVTKTSVAIDGGYPCYQKNFIEKFSIPNLSDDDIIHLRELSSPADIDTYLCGIYHINLPSPNLYE